MSPKQVQLRGPALDRIKARTNRSGECWLWIGRLNRYGYAEMKLGGRYQMAHRVAYEELVGPIEEGLQLDHTDVRSYASLSLRDTALTATALAVLLTITPEHTR